jgi:phosphoribosylanthranilate isomerase
MKSHVLVKICGITRAADAEAAVAAGADAIGFVFWARSPRAIAPETARAIGASLPPAVLRVGVFVDAEPDELRRTADAANLDVLQLHGDEPPAVLAALPRPAWKALRADINLSPALLVRYRGAGGILLDSPAAARGGSGQSFDWSLAAAVRAYAPYLILAGGLDATNVAHAMKTAQPDGVDVSSGVETAPGLKDHARLRDFVAAVRAAS